MNRRGFLRGIVGVAVSAPAIIEALAPTRTIFLPPKGGWAVGIPQRYLFAGHVQYATNEAEVAAEEFFAADAGVPIFLTNYFDPKLIEVLMEPMLSKYQHLMLTEGFK